MYRALEDQRAAWPSQRKQKNGAQAGDDSADWETASSSSVYSWSPPPHSAVRVPGLTMTSNGGVRPRYSPPPYMTGRDYNHIDRPGIRDRCWTQCAALNAQHPRESIIQPQSPLADTQPDGSQMVLGATRRRTSSSASRVSRMMNSASVRSKRSVSSVSSNVIRAASGIVKILSEKSKAVIDRVTSQQKHHINRPTISRPLSRSSLNGKGINGGILRTDFSAANLFHAGVEDDSQAPKDSTQKAESPQPLRLKRQTGYNNLQDPVKPCLSMASEYSSGYEESDYQKFLAAATKHEHYQPREISSLAKAEDSDNITTIIRRYLGEEDGVADKAGINARPMQRAVSSNAQEALKRVTMYETGEVVFFI